MKSNVNITLLLFSFVLLSCKFGRNNENEIIEIDFLENNKPVKSEVTLDTIPIINVAVSAIISPNKSFSYYSELFEYISGKINHQINFKQRKTYQEVNNLLRNGEVDIAFICSGAYIEEKKISDIELLAVPVCNGKPMYNAYIITCKSSGIGCFEDFHGKSFAFTDPLSNTGKLYAEKRLYDINQTAESFFSSTIYSYAHDLSMQLVSKGIVDGATIDGLIYEYQASFYPEQVKNLKIIEKSEDFGIPPVVVPRGLDEGLKSQLKAIFYSIHEDTIGKKILDHLFIEKFIEGKDENYDGIRRIKQDVRQ